LGLGLCKGIVDEFVNACQAVTPLALIRARLSAESKLFSETMLGADGLNHYTVGVPERFATDCDFAQLTKISGDYGQFDSPEMRYSHVFRGLYPKFDKAIPALTTFRPVLLSVRIPRCKGNFADSRA
jgi:hypothetical protein